MNLGTLDYLFGALILAATVRCVLKGFVAEIIAVAALGGGIFAGIVLSGPGAQALGELIGESPWNRVIAFLGIFLGVYLTVKILEGFLYRLLESVDLENLDRALGFFLGLAEGGIISILLLLVLETQPLMDTRSLIHESRFAQFVSNLLPSYGSGLEILPIEVREKGV